MATSNVEVDGGYDQGYISCDCFWGTNPGSLVQRLESVRGHLGGMHVLDAGCGEGKNAIYVARAGSIVDAIDVSKWAISNAQKHCDNGLQINWQVGDIGAIHLGSMRYDLVIAYGLLHCLSSPDAIREAVLKIQMATRLGGYNIVCAFNHRSQQLAEAHPNFHPCLLSHDDYLCMYSDWEILDASDSDLTESHPHNNITHTHSLTRLLARRKDCGSGPA